MQKNRIINYEVILKKVNNFITSKPQSTTHKEFVDSFKGILSAKEADRFWERLLSFGSLFLEPVDTKRYQWKINSNYFTRDSLEKHFRQGDVLSKRGRIPGKKYPKAVKPKQSEGCIIYPGWISSLSL